MPQRRTSNAPTFEIIPVESHTVRCDGGTGALGHPVVFLDMGKANEVVCPYCSRTFVLKPGSHH